MTTETDNEDENLPSTGDDTSKIWIRSNDALRLVRKSLVFRDMALPLLRRGLKQHAIRSSARIIITELDIGAVDRLSRRPKNFILENRSASVGTTQLGAGFWINKNGQTRGYGDWRLGRFAQIYVNSVALVVDGEFLLRPATRMVAYDVHFLRNDIDKIVARHKRKLVALGVHKPQASKTRIRYDWDLILTPLRELAIYGKLGSYNGMISRNGRLIQSSVESVIQELSGCGPSEARRRAQTLVRDNQNASIASN